MNNNWLFEGTDKELSEILPLETANAIIEGFEKYRYLFDDNEYIRSEQIFQKSNIPGVLNLMVPKTNYFINLKRASITLLTFVLDLTLTRGFASTVLGLVGYSTQSIVKLNEENAEKCVYINLHKQKNHTGDWSILYGTSNQCCPNSNLPCKYRIDTKCTITEEIVDDALKSMVEKKVIRKINGDGYYKYKCNL